MIASIRARERRHLKVLVIDDMEEMADLLAVRLSAAGHAASAAYCGADGLTAARAGRPDLVLCDLHLPDVEGLDLLAQLLALSPAPEVMIMTGGGTTAQAVAALKMGAEDYLEKPIYFEELLALIQKLDQHLNTEQKLDQLKTSGTRDALGRLSVYMGAGMQQVYQDLSVAAGQDNVPVLLLGETGSGKEHAARLLHQLSRRFAGPFVELNCASLPEALVESELFGAEAGAYTDAKQRRLGLFEAAQGGTLFLDEVNELSPATQAKLLKVLEEREVRRVGSTTSVPLDLRVVAATNKDLAAEAKAGRFRQDLYYRMSLFTVRLPPLRERRQDIPELADFLHKRACQTFGQRLPRLGAAELADLAARDWPGNVRELRNVIESAVLRARHGRLELAPALAGGAPLALAPAPGSPDEPLRPLKAAVDEAVRAVKRDMLTQALDRSKGSKAGAARLLGTDYKTILNLMKSLGLMTPAGPEPALPALAR